MPLHTLYNAKKFDDLVGNEDAIASLKSVLSREKDKPHAYLFTGPAGCGKSVLSEIVKDELGCHKNDFFCYNASSDGGVGTVREIQKNCVYAPSGGKVKFYLLEESHGLSRSSQEAILETLLKPPPHVYFALCTTEPEKLKASFKRRCHHCIVNPLTIGQLTKLLKSVLKKEGIENYPDVILNKIIGAANGSAGVALNLLDTVIDIEDEKLALNAIINSTVDETAVNEVAQSILKSEDWVTFSKKVQGLKGDAEGLRRAFVTYFGKVMIGSKSEAIASKMMAVMEPLTNNSISMYSGKSGLDYALTFAWFNAKE